MPAPFTSRRERRLWLWTLAVVVAIYSTLGLARRLAGAVGSDVLGPALFVVGMLLVAAAVVAQALRTRPTGAEVGGVGVGGVGVGGVGVGGIEVGVALGVVAAYLMVFVRMASPVERSHLIEYGVVALLVHEALLERARRRGRPRRPAALAILLTATLGAIDEGIQVVVPERVFDPVDIAFNTVAALMAVLASVVLRWARRVSTRPDRPGRVRGRAPRQARRRPGRPR